MCSAAPRRLRNHQRYGRGRHEGGKPARRGEGARRKRGVVVVSGESNRGGGGSRARRGRAGAHRADAELDRSRAVGVSSTCTRYTHLVLSNGSLATGQTGNDGLANDSDRSRF